MNMTDFANRLLAGPPRVCCPACDKEMGLKPPAATEHHGRRGSHGEGEEGMSLKSITNEPCPKCHKKGSLFVCSMGAVNCSNCCEYIRPLTADEWDERQEAIKQISGRYKNRSPLGQSLNNIRVYAQITLREMANAMNVKASTISEWEWGNETPDLGQIADYLRFCLEHIRQAKAEGVK